MKRQSRHAMIAAILAGAIALPALAQDDASTFASDNFATDRWGVFDDDFAWQTDDPQWRDWSVDEDWFGYGASVDRLADGYVADDGYDTYGGPTRYGANAYRDDGDRYRWNDYGYDRYGPPTYYDHRDDDDFDHDDGYFERDDDRGDRWAYDDTGEVGWFDW